MRCGGNIQVINIFFFFFKYRILACGSESFQSRETERQESGLESNLYSSCILCCLFLALVVVEVNAAFFHVTVDKEICNGKTQFRLISFGLGHSQPLMPF